MKRNFVGGVKGHRAKRDLSVQCWTFSVRPFALCASLLFLTLAASSVHATSRLYSTLDQLIEMSDVIAVVTVKNPDKKNQSINPSGRSPMFARHAQIKAALKGQPPGAIVIHHGSALDDHLFQQGPGEYVVFLKMKNGLLTPTDGWPSSKLVTAGRVAGWSDRHTFAKDFAPLPEVTTAIKMKVSR